ncbi:hypothetical protein B0H13DRAFT_1855404 [Mycena leptocephala]|nr:hypothetical protein B0H13DRAFT_1855404 [Mycena leptocephala]
MADVAIWMGARGVAARVVVPLYPHNVVRIQLEGGAFLFRTWPSSFISQPASPHIVCGASVHPAGQRELGIAPGRRLWRLRRRRRASAYTEFNIYMIHDIQMINSEFPERQEDPESREKSSKLQIPNEGNQIYSTKLA